MTDRGDGPVDGNTALMLVDVQQAFDEPGWGARNNPQAEARIARLLQAWRNAGWPVIHVQHCSTEPQSRLREGLPGHAFKPEARPIDGEAQFRKSANSAFIGTTLEAHLRDSGITDVVIAGFVTDHCVSTTARMAANLGFRTTVVGDACATFERRGPDGAHFTAEQMHAANLASLHGEFCEVLDAEQLIQAAGA